MAKKDKGRIEMDMEKLQKTGLRSALQVIFIFLIFLVCSISVFFSAVQKNVEKNAEETVRRNVSLQSYHFTSILEAQFECLEVIADSIGRSEELLSDENLALMQSLLQKGSMERVAIIDADGNSYYDNGMQKSVAAREYFIESMQGKRMLSDPLESKLDGSDRVILSVPIYRGEKIVGVLGGSCNASALGYILLNDVYDGRGYALIAMQDGTIITSEAGEDNPEFCVGNNLFDSLQDMKFEKDGSAETMRTAFLENTSGNVQISDGSSTSYLAYDSLNMNGWVLCYVVSEENVQEDYYFIRQYETMLTAVLGVGALLLLMLIMYLNDRKQKDLMQYAQTDPLTDIYNRRKAEEEIDSWLQGEESEKLQAFCMIDIDYFKTINDVYGHAVGDEVLWKFAKMLRKEFWASDIVGRVGGDEFIILIKNIDSREAAVTFVQMICANMNNIQVKGIEDRKLSCSIGIAYAPEHGTSYQKLYTCADKALYEAKRRGRNGYFEYQE